MSMFQITIDHLMSRPEALRALQHKYQNLIDSIEQDRIDHPVDAEAELLRYVRLRMARYRTRIAEEYKVRKEQDIERVFEGVVNDIFEQLRVMLHADGVVSWEDAHILHTKLFPKGLWGQSRNNRGEIFRVSHPT